jgi:Zn-dependent protease with chaperone function
MDDQPTAQLADEVRGTGRRLTFFRVAGWIILLAELLALWACLAWLAAQPDKWGMYAGTLVVVLGIFHVLPRLLVACLMRSSARVGWFGNRWQIGKYSEAQLRRLIEDVERFVPIRLRRIKVGIVDFRETQAWTYLSVLWPTWAGCKPIQLTSGSLHYLEPEEIRATLLHEIGHHAPGNRIHIPGGWLLTDIVLHAVAICVAVALSWQTGIAFYVATRTLLAWITTAILENIPRHIEHCCDLFAAARVGPVPMINAMLKLGEEEELTEVVLVWAAREFLDAPGLEVEDLALAFSEVRPYGRIFHENLFRHAGEIVRYVEETRTPRRVPGKRGRPANEELAAFVRQRRLGKPRRIRWRKFDRDGDGKLTIGEIAELCDALAHHPDHVLVTSESERRPTSHPPFRDRVLLIYHVFAGLA